MNVHILKKPVLDSVWTPTCWCRFSTRWDAGITQRCRDDDANCLKWQLSADICRPSHDKFCAMEMTKCRFLNVILLFAACFVINGGHGYETLSIQEGAWNEEGGSWQHDV